MHLKSLCLSIKEMYCPKIQSSLTYCQGTKTIMMSQIKVILKVEGETLPSFELLCFPEQTSGSGREMSGGPLFLFPFEVEFLVFLYFASQFFPQKKAMDSP